MHSADPLRRGFAEEAWGCGHLECPLPLTGTPGVECRSGGVGGDYAIVVTFANNVVSGSAAVTSGTGSVAGNPIFSGNTMTVNLTGVGNGQTIAVNLRQM